MKIAIASSGRDMQAQLDPRFGRAPFFVVYDTDTEQFQVVDNAVNLNAAQGAGIQSAQNVASTGADAVIGANFGPKAVQVLQAAGLRMFLCDASTVGEALDKYTAGELVEAAGANVRSHW